MRQLCEVEQVCGDQNLQCLWVYITEQVIYFESRTIGSIRLYLRPNAFLLSFESIELGSANNLSCLFPLSELILLFDDALLILDRDQLLVSVRLCIYDIDPSYEDSVWYLCRFLLVVSEHMSEPLPLEAFFSLLEFNLALLKIPVR